MNNQSIINKFNKNGYVILPKFLSGKDIKNIYFQLEQLINISLEKYPRKSKIKTLDEKYIYLKKINPKLKSHFYDLTKFVDEIINLAGSKKFVNIAKLLLKSKTVLVDSPQIRIDHRTDAYWYPQHQELNQISKDVITFWIPLVNLDKSFGGLYIRPKTHALGHLPYKGSDLSGKEAGVSRQKIIEKLFSKPNLKNFKSIQPKVKAGDAVVFHPFLFHGTNPNKKTKKIRWTYIARYNSIEKSPYLKDGDAKIRIPYSSDYNLI